MEFITYPQKFFRMDITVSEDRYSEFQPNEIGSVYGLTQVVSSKDRSNQLAPSKMKPVSMEDYKLANRQVGTTMGFKLFFALTNKGEMYQVIKKGALCKKDLLRLRDVGIESLYVDWAFAPKFFLVNGKEVVVEDTILELNPDKILREAGQWARVL